MTIALPDFAPIVGAGHVRRASPADTIDGVLPILVVVPGTAEEVAAVLRTATEAGLKVAPRGGGTKIRWGCPPERVDLVLSTSRLGAVLEHTWGDMTATVQAGCTLADFQRTLAERRQQIALDPLWPARATIGGVLATNDSGALRYRYGSLRDLIIGITIALPDGTLAKSGGRVVKNVAGYDLPKLMTGAYGTLGVIVDATFRLYPLPFESRWLRFQAARPARIGQVVQAVRDSTLTPIAIQVVAGAAEPPAIDVQLAGLADAVEAQTDRLLSLASGTAQVEPPRAAAARREELWGGEAAWAVVKPTFLPADITWLCEQAEQIASEAGLRWRLVAQAVGAGLLRFDGDEASIPTAIRLLRSALERREGALIVLDCPAGMKSTVDVWGGHGDAFDLMRRVKQRFDPARTLNPGRFVGGI